MKTQIKTNNYFYLLLTLIALFLAPQAFAEHNDDYRYGNSYNRDLIDVNIVNDRGRQFNQYPVSSNKNNVARAYLEASDGKSYGINVRNNSNERIGLVIAVDGRNIIDGKKSNLRSKERMYILNPYQASTYKGWRSGKNRVNEFYFTDVPDSYADRTFGDRSAMGVIAVAVFKEKNGRWYRDNNSRYDDYTNGNRSKPGSSEKRSAAPQSKGSYEADAAPGTGYGEDRYSPTRRVEFKAEKSAAVKHFLKYEWKETLCEMGTASCRRGYKNKDRNRFWPNEHNGEFAPPPPRYRGSIFDLLGKIKFSQF